MEDISKLSNDYEVQNGQSNIPYASYLVIRIKCQQIRHKIRLDSPANECLQSAWMQPKHKNLIWATVKSCKCTRFVLKAQYVAYQLLGDIVQDCAIWLN